MKEISLFVLLLLGSSPFLFAQDNCQRSSCKWEFFELKETIKGEVVFQELGSDCGHEAWPTASITILKVENDTIRILSSCDNRSYDVGEKIYVTVGGSISKLSFTTWIVGIPIKKKRGWRKEYKKAQAQLPSRFDKVILKTTIGILSDKSDCERSVFKPIHYNSFYCDWNFFEIEQPLQGKIIKYEAQMQPCHILGYASLAIVAIDKSQDTIRVLDYCNTSTFEEGEAVIIEAGEYKSPLTIPYIKTMEDNKIIYRSNEFDTLVFRTTYGEIIHKQ